MPISTDHARRLPEATLSSLLDITGEDSELAWSLLNRLLEELPSQSAAIRLALERSDEGQLASAVHKLKGSLCFFQLDELLHRAHQFGDLIRRAAPEKEKWGAFRELEQAVAAFLEDHSLFMESRSGGGGSM